MAANNKNLIPAKDLAGAFRYKSNPTIELLTNTGIFLWHGREKTEEKTFIISTPVFLKRLRNVESAITKDDPWADKTYYLIQESIDEAHYAFTAKIEELKALVNEQHSRMKFSETEAKKTVELEIESHSRLGWRALEVLLLADDAARLVFEALHRGRVTSREKMLLIKAIESLYRRVLTQVQNYKYFGVTRDDVAANTQPAQKAKAALGDIEKEYLDATVRSSYAPDLSKRRVEVVEEESVLDADVADAVHGLLKKAQQQG